MECTLDFESLSISTAWEVGKEKFVDVPIFPPIFIADITIKTLWISPSFLLICGFN